MIAQSDFSPCVPFIKGLHGEPPEREEPFELQRVPTSPNFARAASSERHIYNMLDSGKLQGLSLRLPDKSSSNTNRRTARFPARRTSVRALKNRR